LRSHSSAKPTNPKNRLLAKAKRGGFVTWVAKLGDAGFEKDFTSYGLHEALKRLKDRRRERAK
jgi:hypothetical protein